jgi:hypothetical protein
VVTIFPFTRCQLQKRDDTSNSYGHSLMGDEAVIEAEGSKTAGIGDMALGP